MNSLCCTLHLVIRCIEFFLQNVYNKAELEELRRIMVVDIGVGWSVYESKKKGEKGKRVRSYSGTQYRKILKKIGLIAKLIKVKTAVSLDFGDQVWNEFRRMLQVVEDGTIVQDCKGGKGGKCGWKWQGKGKGKGEGEGEGEGEGKGKGKGKGKERGEEKEKLEICISCYELKGRDWIRDFCTLHGADTMRIYFHLLMCHAGRLVLKFGGFQELSQQGFERVNCEHNAMAHRHLGQC
jgi:hypothetical protein